MKITKSILTRIIKEEIFELLLMEAKIKVSYEDIESVKALYPNEQDEKALEDLWKKHEKAKEDQKARAKTKALIVWLKTNYISKKRTDHPPHEALPVVEEFIARLNSIKQKYKDDGEFKEKVNKLTKGKPPQINIISAINMEKIFDAFEKKAGDIEGNKEQAQKDKIGETQNWEVFMPTGLGSSCEIGKGTTWCTARTRGDNLFYNYILDSIVLFYVIKKNAGTPPEEHPNDYLSLGYTEDGSKIEEYRDGHTNINSDNKGIDPEQFESIVGAEESQEVYQIIKKRFQDFEEHPAKELLRKAGQDLNSFNSMFTKGQSPQAVVGIVKGIQKLAKEEKGLSPEVKKVINDKVIKMLKNDKNKEKLKGQFFYDIDFRGAELKGLDFREKNFENPNFEGCNLEGVLFGKGSVRNANFKGANLQGAEFTLCVAEYSDFRGADLQSAVFVRAFAKESYFGGANLEGSTFAEAELDRASFRKANLRKANLRKAYLNQADFEGADLQGADLQAVIEEANFQGADLRGANLEWINFRDASFEGADLRGANLHKAKLQWADLEDTDLRGIDFQRVNLHGVKLDRAKLQGANFQGAVLREASLSYVNLQEVNLKGADLEWANFEGADLQGANLERARLEGAELNKAKLQGANLEGADLRGVDFQGVNLEGVNLEGAGLEWANLQGANLQGANIEGASFFEAKYDSQTKFPEGFNPETKELKIEMKFNKSKLFKMIKEEILLELLLMEAKLKVSLDDLELAEKRYPEDEALAKLRKDHEDKKDRAKTKKMIFWVKTAYAGDRPQEVHPPREALPQLENFLDNLKRIKNKYKGSQPFKDKIDQITDGGKIGGDPLHPNLFNSDNFIGIMRALEGRTGEIEKDDVQAEKDKIGETANWNVYMPTTMGSSCELGKGTTWCTSRTEGNNLFYNYVARKKNIVLFYAIHKEAGPPKEDPEDYLSLGYFEDGRRVERYGYGETNIDANNDGIDPKEFELIVGKTEAEEIYSIIEKKFETMKEHPAKEMVKKAAKDLEAYNSMFPKGMGGDEALDLIRIIDEYGPLPEEIEKSRHQKLTDAARKGAKLKDITLRNMDLRGLKTGKEIMKPTNVKFINVNLEKVNFSELEAGECFFKKVNLRESNMSMADVFDTTFEEADLGRANISKATLYKCSIRKSYFTDANMEFSNIGYSSLDEVDFEGANLKDAELKDCTISKSNFSKATLNGVSFESSSFESTKFQQTKIENAYTEEASFRACDFKGSELIGDFEDVSFSGSDFSGADLSKARFENCNLEGANFSGAILSSGDSHVDFGNSNLEGSTYNSETVYNDMMIDPEREGMTMA